MEFADDWVRDPDPDPATSDPADGRRPGLEFHTLAELRAIVAARGPRRWLLRGVWPAGDYGVHAASPKGQKTMNTADLAVAVASGTPWLGLIEIDDPGPVVMFVGEGGDGDTVRRLTAAAEARGLDPDQLPIHICTRAPNIGNTMDLAEFTLKVEDVRPVLVTLDPLYLAAPSAKLGDLYSMGALLQGPQLICQRNHASLWVVHHNNRQAGSGSGRMSGAGPQEWGRVLVSAAVKSRRTDPTTLATTVITELDFQGGSIPDQTFRVVRHTWADDPDNLDSPLHIETTTTRALDNGETDNDADPSAIPGVKMTPGKKKLYAALQAADHPATIKDFQAWMADHDSPPLKRETCSRFLTEMLKAGMVDSVEQGQFAPALWFLAPRDITRDDHTEGSRVTSVTAPIEAGGHTVTQSHEAAEPADHTTLFDDQEATA